ncbi:MAG TPA: alpha/beta hydrolase [Jatrophihabitantaceae bacterium]
MAASAVAGVDEAGVACRATGSGSAVLFIHGGATDSRLWDGQVSEFADDYRVITYDMRGFGRSPRPTHPYRMSDDAVAVLDHLGVTSAAVVGFSIGAQIALELAVRTPDRVAALAVMGAGPWSDPVPDEFEPAHDELREQLASRDEARRRGDLATSVALDLDVWASTHRGVARAALTRLCMQAPYFNEYREGQSDWLEQLPTISDDELAAIAAPSLIVVGDSDVRIVRLASARLAVVLPHVVLRTFPDADHYVSTSQPALFNQVLRGFLDRCRADGAW